MTKMYANTPYIAIEITTQKMDGTLYYNNAIVTELNKASIDVENFNFDSVYEACEKFCEPEEFGKRYKAVVSKELEVIKWVEL